MGNQCSSAHKGQKPIIEEKMQDYSWLNRESEEKQLEQIIKMFQASI
jgi:hypothetical protein